MLQKTNLLSGMLLVVNFNALELPCNETLFISNVYCPNNSVIKPPKVNIELSKLLSTAQKKSDVKFSILQKSLKKVCMNATIALCKLC